MSIPIEIIILIRNTYYHKQWYLNNEYLLTLSLGLPFSLSSSSYHCHYRWYHQYHQNCYKNNQLYHYYPYSIITVFIARGHNDTDNVQKQGNRQERENGHIWEIIGKEKIDKKESENK